MHSHGSAADPFKPHAKRMSREPERSMGNFWVRKAGLDR
jgi:hypothetical protein